MHPEDMEFMMAMWPIALGKTILVLVLLLLFFRSKRFTSLSPPRKKQFIIGFIPFFFFSGLFQFCFGLMMFSGFVVGMLPRIILCLFTFFISWLYLFMKLSHFGWVAFKEAHDRGQPIKVNKALLHKVLGLLNDPHTDPKARKLFSWLLPFCLGVGAALLVNFVLVLAGLLLLMAWSMAFGDINSMVWVIYI